MISVVIPAYNEEKYIGATLQSLIESMKECPEEVEIIVVDNNSMDNTRKVALEYEGVKCFQYPVVGQVHAKNFGASIARGDILIFIDADCTVEGHLFKELSEKSKNPYFVGGGINHIKFTRMSLGIMCFIFLVAVTMILNQITVCGLWVRKGVFDSIGGFRNPYQFQDINFAKKLKQYAKEHYKKFESLKECNLTWSTRKFDEWGDWHWVKGYRTEKLGS